MLRRLGIRAKVLAVLAVPVVALALVAIIVGLVTGAGSTTVVALAGVAVAALVLHFVLASAVGASITRPLEDLGAAADEVGQSLPSIVERVSANEDVEFSAIPVESNDEIGRLTAAINDLSTTTITFAKTQAGAGKDVDDIRGQIAGMFVNVARRDQTLLKRLLSQLDQLERAEENPDTLDALFKLDHLATRMRRNAESLLVLAGRESSRRRRQPMPLTDVVRSASSEIEHYERVDLAQYVDPSMLGHSALATAHLLAELLENATRYSDPGSRVAVQTNEGPKGIRITITDTGLGMSDEELASFNDRIANPPTDEVIAAEKMGFYVVGRLAKKLEASVVLAKGQTKGTVATVDLAPALFVPGSVATQDEPAADFGMGGAGWVPEVEMEPGRGANTPTPDLSSAASALQQLEQTEQMISPEIVAAPSRPGGLPSRGLPARGPKPPAAAAPSAPPAAPGGSMADALAAAAATPDSGQAPEPEIIATSQPDAKPKPLASRGRPAATPAPSDPMDELAAVEAAEARVPTQRETPRGGGLFGGFPKKDEAPTAPPAAPAGPGSSSLASRMGGSDNRAAASELSSLSRVTQAKAAQGKAAAAPAAPAPAAPAPVAPTAPMVGAGGLNILPGGGGKGRKRRMERAAAPMPSVSQIAAAAAAADEAYVPKAFVPSTPLGESAPAPGGEGSSSLSDVLRARSAMASAALSELSQLSGTTPLVRRERGATEAGKAAAASQARAEQAPVAPARPTRSASDVRSMLSGFQAGVVRGRSSDAVGEGGKS